jgi:hypothetical protein
VKVYFTVVVGLQKLNIDNVTLGDSVLLAARFDHCVHKLSNSNGNTLHQFTRYSQ